MTKSLDLQINLYALHDRLRLAKLKRGHGLV